MTSRVIPTQHVDLWKCARREVQFCQELWPRGFMSAAVQVGLFVRDNDIRIIPKHHQRIFDGLKRLHPREDYRRGTSAGINRQEDPRVRGRRTPVESDPEI